MKMLYIPGCTNCPYICSNDLYSALERASVWFIVNRVSSTLHVRSRYLDAPLTQEEKDGLIRTLEVNGCPYKIIFSN